MSRKIQSLYQISIKIIFALIALILICPLTATGESIDISEINGLQGDGLLMYALNVGKADCIIIQLEGKSYMIDTGSVQSTGVMRTALSYMGIHRLEGVFITHSDKDHIGGLYVLASSGIEIGQIYASATYIDYDYQSHPAVIAAGALNQSVKWLKAGDKIQITQSAFFDVLGPISLNKNSENDNSLVMSLQSSHGSILLTGDMESDEEEALFQAGAFAAHNILKVPYHGSDKAASTAFIYQVAPQMAVISTNTTERKSTPGERVLKDLAAIGARTAVTQDGPGGVLVTLKNNMTEYTYIDFDSLPAINTSIDISFIDIKDEVLAITNNGSEAVSLTDWYIYSSRGDEMSLLPSNASLLPGETKTLGTQSTKASTDWRWLEKNVWHDTKSDDVVLYDSYGRIAAQTHNQN